jgi:tetratricopeptide (TPR) repeat protein
MPADLVQKAIDLLEKGRAEQAAPLLEDVVAAFPAYAGAYVLLARAYENGERWTRARDAWRSALLLVPDSPVAAEGIRRTMREGRRATPLPVGTDDDTLSAVAALHQESEVAGAASMDEAVIDVSIEDEDAATPAEKREAEPPADIPVPSYSPDDNLDRLISELEGARITPRPDIDSIPEPDLEDDIEDMVSETLARIYASQSQYIEAARVYDTLAQQNPERRTYFHQKAREMRAAGGEGDDE